MIDVIKALFLGIVQGLTEFFPVSSSGHLALFAQLLNIKMADELLFSICLHIGTLAAVVLVFRKDLFRMLAAAVGMYRDIIHNLSIYLHNTGSLEKAHYRRILSTNYRQLTAMILLSCIPTGIMGFLLEGAAQKASSSLLMPGMFFFMTGIVLLVVDKVADRNLTPKEVPMKNALLIGLAQGAAVMPGLSRSGMTICASLLCGMSRKLAVRYSFILSVPTMIGALIFECGVGYGGEGQSLMSLMYGLIGALSAGIISYFTIRKMLQIVRKKQLYYFSYYCFAIGIVTVIGYFYLNKG